MAIQQFSNPIAIAEAGEQMYNPLRADLEANHRGKFVAIDVKTGAYYLGDGAEEALEAARSAEPLGMFHLIRIGFAGAFQISHAFQRTNFDWLSQ